MGFKLSKVGPLKAENQIITTVQHRLVNYISTSVYIRKLVSKKRRRLLVGGYDLDMSYITERLLAMSFPAERMRAVYRNPLWQVKSVLNMRHQGHYKVYNLCIEEAYDPSHFHGRVERYPYDDNHVPPLALIKEFCEDVHSWLSDDPKNIAVIHCMAGKGRTGMMVSCYLVYLGMTADEALQLYAQKRTTNNEGVSIPSQRRYVSYWESLLSFQQGFIRGPPNVILPKPCSRELWRVRLYDTVNIASVFFVVSELHETAGERYQPAVELSKSCCRQIKKGIQRTYSPQYHYSFIGEDGECELQEPTETRLVAQMDTESPILYQKNCLDCYFEKPVQVTGDVRIIFYEKLIGGRLFYACFNTAFIKNSLLLFSVQELDKVGKKGSSICGPSFFLELMFGPANANHLRPTPFGSGHSEPLEGGVFLQEQNLLFTSNSAADDGRY